jgi:hypothetical protein
MGSVTSPNPGIADLLQILSNSGSSALSSTLSSPTLQSALQHSSPSDLVQLSNQALKLQVANDLFGSPDPARTPGYFPAASPPSSSATLDNLLTSLYSSSPGSTAAGTPTSTANQLAIYQSEVQSQQAQALFGTATTAGTSGTLVNVLG